MQNTDFTIKLGCGKYTPLDKAYSRLIHDIIRKLDDSLEERWETYGLIMDELLEIGRGDVFEEIKYKLTDDEDPNEVFLETLDGLADRASILWFLRRRIDDYIEEDFYSRFN